MTELKVVNIFQLFSRFEKKPNPAGIFLPIYVTLRFDVHVEI